MTSNQCALCEYYYGRRKCVAFPEEIPDDFWVEGVDHNKPIEKQYGQIVFEKSQD